MTLLDDLDLFACDGCGRSFTSIDGESMMAVLKGPCPDCGGRFRLRGVLRVEDVASERGSAIGRREARGQPSPGD